MTIDKDKLRELASDPNNSTMDVLKGLGFNNYATFSYNLKKDAEAQAIFDQARGKASDAEGGERSQPTANNRGTRKPRRASAAAAPPRKPRSNGNHEISEQLLRRIAHEFEHVELYDEITEHFKEVATELRQAL
jgi:hypothetical protein